MRTSIITILSCLVVSVVNAKPLEYTNDDFTARVSGYGNIGMIEPDMMIKKSKFLGDWSARLQATYDADETHRLGAVYSLDQQTIDEDEYVDDLFALWQFKGVGRIEIGLTDSVAEKLGLGLPDVGGVRMNDNPMFYKEIMPSGAVIADTILDSGDGAPRVNVVSASRDGVQYGLSVAGFSNDYDFVIDGGIKLRYPHGKTKTAYSFGASFMSRPNRFDQSRFSPNVSADWRTQFSAAMNLQYNSLMFALSALAIYDENPIGVTGDGVIIGTGLSYDLLKYTVSLSYTVSDTGIWHNDIDNFINHTLVSSFRYKYSEVVDGWFSIGLTDKTPFLAAGIRATF